MIESGAFEAMALDMYLEVGNEGEVLGGTRVMCSKRLGRAWPAGEAVGRGRGESYRSHGSQGGRLGAAGPG